jgi:hypothetical protein
MYWSCKAIKLSSLTGDYMNLFRQTKDGALDKQYLRICAVHKLLDAARIDKSTAINMLSQRGIDNPRRLVELWLANPKQNFSA